MGVNTKLLERRIRELGLKRSFIAEKLGLSLTSLSYKISGLREFKSSEIGFLIEILQLETMEEVRQIFFAKNVA